MYLEDPSLPDPATVSVIRYRLEAVARQVGVAMQQSAISQLLNQAYDFSTAIFDIIRSADVDLVCLAGFLSLLEIPDAFAWRVLNIHPALLPAFPGLHVQDKAWAHGVRISGCTVHLVDEGMDPGPIVGQAAVPVLADDSAEDLQPGDRVSIGEYQLSLVVEVMGDPSAFEEMTSTRKVVLPGTSAESRDAIRYGEAGDALTLFHNDDGAERARLERAVLGPAFAGIPLAR